MKNTQIFLTPNEGKQLIADALASLDFVQEAMREHYDLLELSRKLVTIVTDAPFELDPAALTVEDIYNPLGYEIGRYS